MHYSQSFHFFIARFSLSAKIEHLHTSMLNALQVMSCVAQKQRHKCSRAAVVRAFSALADLFKPAVSGELLKEDSDLLAQQFDSQLSTLLTTFDADNFGARLLSFSSLSLALPLS